MVAFARNTDVPASVHLGNRVAARTRNGVFRNGKYEGRLVETESLPSVPDAAKVKVENVYDYLGRRVSKTVSTDYTGGVYTTTNVTTFVYDGWLPITEITDDGANVATNLNVWGLDLSGALAGLQRPGAGAGGIGGLLAAFQDGESYFTCMDGNGNVCQYVDASGSVVAYREYDPFGGTVALTGARKDDFAAWFSTKPLDRETGLYAYTFRYYDPERGRWLNRDPIGEQGGYNVYGFIKNDGMNKWDFLGLAELLVAILLQREDPGNFFGKALAGVAERTMKRGDVRVDVVSRNILSVDMLNRALRNYNIVVIIGHGTQRRIDKSKEDAKDLPASAFTTLLNNIWDRTGSQVPIDNLLKEVEREDREQLSLIMLATCNNGYAPTELDGVAVERILPNVWDIHAKDVELEFKDWPDSGQKGGTQITAHIAALEIALARILKTGKITLPNAESTGSSSSE